MHRLIGAQGAPYFFSSRFFNTLILLFTTLYLPCAHAEVIDKVPTLPFIWAVATSSGAICLVAAFFRRWLLILVVPPGIWFFNLFLEIHSADVGPALLAEAGPDYIAHSYLAAFIVIALGALGWILNTRKRRV